MGSYRFLWVLMGSKEYLFGPYGFLWVLISSNEYLWVLMGPYGS